MTEYISDISANCGKANKRLYLTFDDGPSREYTEELLDLLKEHGVKATFFVVGQFAKNNPEIIERMISEGHEIGLHSNRHISAYLMSNDGFDRDMDKAFTSLATLGVWPKLYRPPWGHMKKTSSDTAMRYGMRTVKWDIMAEDWRAFTTSEEIKEKILNRVFDRAVICLHDGRGRNGAPKRTIEALKSAIPELIERGYSFETMS